MKVYITSGTSWAGAITDGSNITVECIGGGGSGGGGKPDNFDNSCFGSGGGGGEYAKKSVAYTSGSTVNGIQIGQGGSAVAPETDGNDGTETHWNTNVVIAKGGKGGKFPSSWDPIAGGAGGTGGTGDTKYNGGNGGQGLRGSYQVAGGGGGAAGLNAAGNNGQNAGTSGGNGGQGDGTYGGAGGEAGAYRTSAKAGGDGTEWSSSPKYGSGGGGGGGPKTVYDGWTGGHGGNGGLYGGGGGGMGGGNYLWYWVRSGAGANGLIVVTYTPSVSAFIPRTMWFN